MDHGFSSTGIKEDASVEPAHNQHQQLWALQLLRMDRHQSVLGGVCHTLGLQRKTSRSTIELSKRGTETIKPTTISHHPLDIRSPTTFTAPVVSAQHSRRPLQQIKKVLDSFSMLVKLATVLAAAGISSVHAQVYECDSLQQPNYDSCKYAFIVS